MQVKGLVTAINDGDDAMVQDAVIKLSRSRRVFAPLVFVVGAFAMLFEGVKLLLSNWRLTLVQVLPAMWIWVALIDLKAHTLYGKSFHDLRGPRGIPLIAGIALVTMATFYLNAVFAFAISVPGTPQIRPAFARARAHLLVIAAWGLGIGVLLGVSVITVPRWGTWWFAVSLSIVIGIMMLCYVAVPSRLVGITASYSKRDKLTATAVGGAIGAAVCTPPYLIGRLGILMLGSHVLFIPGIFVLALGLTLETGATTSVKAIKLSAKLAAGRTPAVADNADQPTKVRSADSDRPQQHHLRP